MAEYGWGLEEDIRMCPSLPNKVCHCKEGDA